MNIMQIEYKLTIEDLVAVEVFETQQMYRRFLLILRFGATLIIYLGVLWMFYFAKSPIDLEFIISVLPILLVPIWWSLFAHRLFYRFLEKFIRMYYDFKSNPLIWQRKLSISSDGIKEITELTESQARWGSVEKIMSTNTHLFISCRPMLKFIVPLHAFPDDTTFKQFTETAKQLHQSATDRR